MASSVLGRIDQPAPPGSWMHQCDSPRTGEGSRLKRTMVIAFTSVIRESVLKLNVISVAQINGHPLTKNWLKTKIRRGGGSIKAKGSGTDSGYRKRRRGSSLSWMCANGNISQDVITSCTVSCLRTLLWEALPSPALPCSCGRSHLQLDDAAGLCPKGIHHI